MNTRCTYCLKHFDELTSDHVLPESWYPAGMSDNVEKWQVPACEACNQGYSKIEDELIRKMGLCLDPTDPKFEGITNKATRAFTESCGKSDADRKHRRRWREILNREIIKVKKDEVSASIIPGFDGWDVNDAVFISTETFNKFAEKLVRGIAYITCNTYIEPSHEIEIIMWKKMPPQLDDFLKKAAKTFDCGKTISVRIWFEPTDPQSSFCEIAVWNKFRISAIVSPSEKP